MNSGSIACRDEPLLSLNELANIANRDGVDVATVERDYAMTHIIASLADQPTSERLEFKGGTSLRLCHFPDYRYSADLDMNLTGGLSREEALQGIERALMDVREPASDQAGWPRRRQEPCCRHALLGRRNWFAKSSSRCRPEYRIVDENLLLEGAQMSRRL